MLVYAAILFSALAFASGILVIGNGSQFQYKLHDVLRGRDNAILYIWITLSTMFSLAHFAILMQYGIANDFGYAMIDDTKWMSIHTAVGVLFVFAHVYIRTILIRTAGLPARYLWSDGVVPDAS